MNQTAANLKSYFVLDFDWSVVGPDPSIGQSFFSVNWTGGILPQFTENYTFYILVCDGARLWVNGQLLIEQWWPDVLPTEYSASIPIPPRYFQVGRASVPLRGAASYPP